MKNVQVPQRTNLIYAPENEGGGSTTDRKRRVTSGVQNAPPKPGNLQKAVQMPKRKEKENVQNNYEQVDNIDDD